MSKYRQKAMIDIWLENLPFRKEVEKAAAAAPKTEPIPHLDEAFAVAEKLVKQNIDKNLSYKQWKRLLETHLTPEMKQAKHENWLRGAADFVRRGRSAELSRTTLRRASR